MEHLATGGNWTVKLADAVENWQPGDTIVVETAAAVELGQDAAKRLNPAVPPDAFVIREPVFPFM